tara:strand:- start:658 stop:1065 length:408 start_codon:yes stop_codon:yes gene_type:complete
MKIDRQWKLPKPEVTEGGYVWHPVVRVGRYIPFGYEQDPEDQDILLPIEDELELYEKAKRFLKQYSYRDVSNWLSTQSGRYISHVGLYKRVNIEQKRKTKASNKRYLAKRYKEAFEKAEKIEARIKGSREASSIS